MRMNVRALRQAKRLTIDQMAAMTGLSRGFLSQIETGKRQPGTETLRTIAEALGVSVARLVSSDNDTDHLLRAIELFRTLPPEDQRALVLMAESLAKKHTG
jgi:transcriptional regulator with XRE-family HTH domain